MGLDINYITGSGEKTYRGVRFQDEKVKAAVEAYEADVQKIVDSGYWDTDDQVLNAYRKSYPWLSKYPTYDDFAEAVKTDYSLRRSSAVKNIEARIQKQKERIRQQHPEIAATLIRWGFKTPSLTELRRGIGQE